jgi:hypothetical protein
VKEDMVAAYQANPCLEVWDWKGFEIGWKTFVKQDPETDETKSIHWFYRETGLVGEYDILGFLAGYRAAKAHFTICIAA